MKPYYAYDPEHPKEILGEVHTIEDGFIYLNHIPFKNSISIEGFIQTDSMVLLPGQFFCDYGDDLYYRESSCVVYFNEAHNNQRVIVNYLCVGTIIVAEDLNEIKQHLENRNIHNTYQLPTASTLEKGGVRIGQGLEMAGDILNCTVQSSAAQIDFSAHNESSSAHPYIQNLIGDEIEARVQSVSELNRRIDNLPARNVNFLGSADAFPAQKSFGDFIFVGGKPYIFDGNSWLSFCTCAAEPEEEEQTLWSKVESINLGDSDHTSFADWRARWLPVAMSDFEAARWNGADATLCLPAEYATLTYGSDYVFMYPPNDGNHLFLNDYDTPAQFPNDSEQSWTIVDAAQIQPESVQPDDRFWLNISAAAMNNIMWTDTNADWKNYLVTIYRKE